jgi:hypothetical protein
MRASVQRLERLVEPALLCAAAVWTLWFFRLQLYGITDAHFLEWDARSGTLGPWRYHGTGLFPNDLLIDFADVYYPAGVKAVYWIGTLFTNPFFVSKLVPFLLGAIVVWQSYALGRALGGRVLGAAAVVLLLHCLFVWGRIVGVNARAFGFPLMVSFMRYAVERRERPALAVLFAETWFYPSTFLICAPAWGMTLLWPWKLDRRWLRYFAVVGAGLAVVALTTLHTDPRIGHPIRMSELMTLRQRGIVGTWPMPPAIEVMRQTAKTALYDDYGVIRWLDKTPARVNGLFVAIVAGALALLLLVRRRRLLAKVPIVFPALFVGSMAAFAVAQSVPYRLYIPDRLLLYAWPPLLLFGLLLLAYLAFSTVTTPRWAAVAAAIVCCALELGFYGDGFIPNINVHNWTRRDDATVRFAATLPKDVLIAAPFDTSSNIQAFARRKVLFSSILNTPIHYPIAVELERRIEEYYLAYYARDLAPVRAMRDTDHVDYLVVDGQDFGPDAVKRAEYLMWTPLARSLITAGPRDQMIFAHPPDAAVVFRRGLVTVIDLRKL